MRVEDNELRVKRDTQALLAAAAIVGVMSLRFLVGPFPLQGLLYVAVVAVAAWRGGVATGVVATLMGAVAAHAQRFMLEPALLTEPSRLFTSQYFTGYGMYVLLCGLAVLVGRRHRATVTLLDTTREQKARDEIAHRHQLEEALAREQQARIEAEEANRRGERLVDQLARELQRARELASIVESTDDAILSTDLESRITSWNRAAERLFGFTAAEALGRPIYVLIPDERQQEEQEVLERVRRGDNVVHFETRRRHRDGAEFDVSLTVSPIRDEQGQVVGISKIARDITARRATEAEVAGLQSRLVALAAASSLLLRSPRVDDMLPAVLSVARDLLPADGYAVWRKDASNEEWRIAAHEGLSPAFADDIIGWGDLPGGPEPVAFDDAGEAVLSARQAAYAREGIRSLLLVPLVMHGRTTGTTVFYHRTPHRFSPSELEAARAFGNVVSAALTAAELYEEQQRSRMDSDFLAEAGRLLANSLDYSASLRQVAGLAVPFFADFCAVDLLDGRGELSRLCVAHADPARVAVAQAFRQRYPENPRSETSVAHAIRTRTPLMVEWLPDEAFDRRAIDAEHRQALAELDVRSFMIVPLVARDKGLGAFTFALGASRHRYTKLHLRLASAVAARAALAVDNARAYEEATRANRLKDEFLATLSHELRTPLNAVVGYARMASGGVLEGPRLARALDTIDRNATTLTRLVEDVLDMSRFVSGKVQLELRPVDLGVVVDQAMLSIRPAAQAKGVHLETRLTAGALRVSGDPDRLQQVLWNLLSNAVKFTPAGGTVALELSRQGDAASVAVRDSGCGISPAFLPYVFERFRQGDARFSREHGGLGLGLAIARDLVQLHGGTIEAHSDGLGHGAAFRVRLPVLAEGGEVSTGHAPSAGTETAAVS